jgi:hypothetical protein
MKSAPKISSNSRSPRSDSSASPAQRSFPLTDHSYQSRAEVETRSASSAASIQQPRALRELHTFRSISTEFFGTEATVNYVADVVFFACITCIAAWPIVVAIHQLTRWTI